MMVGRSVQVLAMALGVASIAAFGSATTGRAQTGAGTSDLAFAAADTNGDGFIDEAELGSDQAKRFHSLDADRDGFLVPDELVDADIAAFRKLDTNGDGRLSFTEVWPASSQTSGGPTRTATAVCRSTR
jgi:hypothetical protein